MSGLAFAQTSTTTPAQTKPKTSTSKAAGTKTAAKSSQQSSTAKPASPKWEHPVAVFDTSMGKISCELYPDKAPKAVENFIGLARGTKEWKHPFTGQVVKGKPLYDGVVFHRVIPNFMIQGGDPQGNGSGNPGYQFADEFSPDLRFDRPGRLAMANSGPNTNGSQFFITEVPTPWLNDRHTIFGQCDEPSVALVYQIARVPTDPRTNLPMDPVTIKHISILGLGEPAKPTATTGPTTKSKSKAAPSKAKPTTKPQSTTSK
jgi:cyclophilin family peptidyl-prolyl cis-trans isomerase